MCTPIVIDSPQVDLSDDPTKAKPDPAGTSDASPGPASTPVVTPASDGTAPAPANLPGPKLANGVPINGGVALPEDNATLDPTGANNPATGADTGNPKSGIPGGENNGVAAGPGGTVNPGTDGTAPDTPLDANTLLINSLTDLAHKFTDTTAGILQGQTDATNALKDGFLSLTDQQAKALKAADELRKNTGQASRKPNYSLSLAANRRTNSRGASSTMLTGSAGVPTNSLALGRAQLLGGADA